MAWQAILAAIGNAMKEAAKSKLKGSTAGQLYGGAKNLLAESGGDFGAAAGKLPGIYGEHLLGQVGEQGPLGPSIERGVRSAIGNDPSGQGGTGRPPFEQLASGYGQFDRETRGVGSGGRMAPGTQPYPETGATDPYLAAGAAERRGPGNAVLAGGATALQPVQGGELADAVNRGFAVNEPRADYATERAFREDPEGVPYEGNKFMDFLEGFLSRPGLRGIGAGIQNVREAPRREDYITSMEERLSGIPLAAERGQEGLPGGMTPEAAYAEKERLLGRIAGESEPSAAALQARGGTGGYGGRLLTDLLSRRRAQEAADRKAGLPRNRDYAKASQYMADFERDGFLDDKKKRFLAAYSKMHPGSIDSVAYYLGLGGSPTEPPGAAQEEFDQEFPDITY